MYPPSAPHFQDLIDVLGSGIEFLPSLVSKAEDSVMEFIKSDFLVFFESLVETNAVVRRLPFALGACSYDAYKVQLMDLLLICLAMITTLAAFIISLWYINHKEHKAKRPQRKTFQQNPLNTES